VSKIHIVYDFSSLRAGFSRGKKAGEEKGKKSLHGSLRILNDAPKKPCWCGTKQVVKNQSISAHMIWTQTFSTRSEALKRIRLTMANAETPKKICKKRKPNSENPNDYCKCCKASLKIVEGCFHRKCFVRLAGFQWWHIIASTSKQGISIQKTKLICQKESANRA